MTSTCLYAYVSDCYKPQTPESAVLLNFSRGLSFCIGFFGIPFVNRIGFTGPGPPSRSSSYFSRFPFSG